MKVMAPGTALCTLDEIPDPGAIGIEIAGGSDIVIARQGDAARAYVNACPHQGTPLEIFPNRFLTIDKKHLLCTTHGAQFRIKDGMCIRGPCKGQALQPVRIKVLKRTIRTI